MLRHLVTHADALWKKYRLTPKRFYRYGTLGLGFYDDRTALEIVCDNMDSWFLKQREKFWIATHTPRKHIWHTFRDISTKNWISSMSDIKKIEKETGMTYISFSDIEKEADRSHNYIQKRNKENSKKYFGNVIREIKQGRSFVKEIREKIEKGQYEVGQKRAFNG